MRSLLIGILLLPSLALAWETPEVRPQIGQVVRVELLAWIKLGNQWTEEWLEVRTITYTGTWPAGEGAVGEKVLRWEPAGPTMEGAVRPGKDAVKTLKKHREAAWCRYRAARLFYIGARVSGYGRFLSAALSIFEAVRPNPYIKITLGTKPPNAKASGVPPQD